MRINIFEYKPKGVLCLEENIRKNHSIIVENRKKFILTGVKDVLSFDEQTVMLETELGRLAVKGDDLKLGQFNTDKGDVTGTGTIHAFIYTADTGERGLFSRIFK